MKNKQKIIEATTLLTHEEIDTIDGDGSIDYIDDNLVLAEDVVALFIDEAANETGDWDYTTERAVIEMLEGLPEGTLLRMPT